MPANSPRVNVVLERPLYEALKRLAQRDGTSLSLKARDLLRDAPDADLELLIIFDVAIIATCTLSASEN